MKQQNIPKNEWLWFYNIFFSSENGQDSPTDRYEGEWKEGKYSGKGTYIWKDGQKLEGQFENGLGVGFAVYTYKQVPISPAVLHTMILTDLAVRTLFCQ